MGEPWARHDERQQPKTQETLPTAGFPIERMTRFELATLTLAKKVKYLARRDRHTPPSRHSPVCSSAQPAESAPLQRVTFNALNLYRSSAAFAFYGL